MNQHEKRKIIKALLFPLFFVVMCWLIWLLDSSGDKTFYHWGISPRSLLGLRGIVAAPFIHDASDIAHILNNTTPFLFLGWALFYFYPNIAFRVILAIMFLGGFWVWLIGQPNSFHVGASGILYGLAAFLFYSGILRMQVNVLALTFLVTFLYGGMIWGIFPYDIRISWESHLFGGIAGILLAIYYRKSGWQRERYEWENEENSDSFSVLQQRHEDVLQGKIPDPNLPSEEEPPPISFIYVYKGKSEDEES